MRVCVYTKRYKPQTYIQTQQQNNMTVIVSRRDKSQASWLLTPISNKFCIICCYYVCLGLFMQVSLADYSEKHILHASEDRPSPPPSPTTRPVSDGPSMHIPLTRPVSDGPSLHIPLTRPVSDGPSMHTPLTRPESDSPSMHIPLTRPVSDSPSLHIPFRHTRYLTNCY